MSGGQMALFTATRRSRRVKHKCDRCGKRLKEGRWIKGRDTRLTDGKRRPRYCWPGEGCNK